MGFIDYVIIALFMLGMVAIGFYFKARNNDVEDYLVGGRKLGISVFIATYLATCIGGGTLNGWIGTVYDSGLTLIPSMITMYILTLILSLVLAAKLRKFGGFTAPDVLKKNYDNKSQAIGGVLSFIYMLGTGPAMNTITFGMVIHVVTGISFVWGCIISTVVILLYTYTSGFWGVVMTDYAQFLIMAAGVAFAGYLCFNKVGGWEGIVANVPASHLSVSSGNTMTIIKLIVTTALPIIIDGNRYQRFYACKDEKTAKKGTLLAIIPLHLFYMMVLLIGTCAYILIPNIKADTVFATLVLEYLPTGLRGVVFASLLATIMSTCDSYLLVCATNFSNDIYKNIINRNADDKRLVSVTRTGVLVISLLGLIMAVWLQSIMNAWALASAAYVGGCFIPMSYALFFNKTKKSALAANVGMMVGGSIGAFFEIVGITVMGMPAAVCGAIACLTVFVPITLMDKKAKMVSLV